MRPDPGSPQQLDPDTRIIATDALAQGQRVARRERSERPDRYIESDVDDQPDSHAIRIPMFPEAADAIPDPPHLSDRIRRGRRRVGWR